jgi:hypothetical protein
MTDENKDLNIAQPVTESQDLNNADVVNQPDLTAQPVQEQNQEVLADGTDANKDVPYSKLKEATDARKVAEEQAAHAQRTLELYQAQTAQAQQTYVQPKSVSDQALDNCGFTADDLYGENIVKFQNEKDRIDSAQRLQDQTTMAQQQFVMSHPDSNQVVGSVNPVTGQFIGSPELLALLAKKPHLTGACNSVEIAYELVMQERQLNELQKTQTITQEQQTRQTIDNKTQPMGGSAAGGMGGGSPQGQGLMTREQVLEIEAGLS